MPENLPPDGPPTPPAPQNDDYASVKERLNRWKIMLTNALANPQIIAALVDVGYKPEDLDEHLTEVEEVRLLNEAKAVEYGQYRGAHEDYNAAQAAAHKNYTKHLKLARIKFRQDVNALVALDLVGRRGRSQGDYILQALNFYNNGLKAPYQAGLATKGLTAAKLQAGATAYAHLQALLAATKKEGGEAQGATAARNRRLDPLEDWMEEFEGSARVALEGEGQLMEQMGMVEDSETF